MMEQDIVSLFTQFGAAGLIGWMWLTERRHAAKREQQLSEAHERLREERVAIDQLLAVVSENTRAVATLEASQRALLSYLHRQEPPKSAGANEADRAAA